jgi:hypothetical protein
METFFLILSPDVLLLQEWLDLQDLKNLALTCKNLKEVVKTLIHFTGIFPRKQNLIKINRTSFLFLKCKHLQSIDLTLYGKNNDNEAFSFLSLLSKFQKLERFTLHLQCSPCNISGYFEKDCWFHLKEFQIISDSCRRRYGKDLNMLLEKCLASSLNLEKLRIDCLSNENLLILKSVIKKNSNFLKSIHLDFFTFTKPIFYRIIEILRSCKNLEELHIISGTVVLSKIDLDLTNPIIKLLEIKNKINILEIDVFMMKINIKNKIVKNKLMDLKSMKLNNWIGGKADDNYRWKE